MPDRDTRMAATCTSKSPMGEQGPRWSTEMGEGARRIDRGSSRLIAMPSIER